MRSMRSSPSILRPIAIAIALIGLAGCSKVDRARWKARLGNADAQIAVAPAYAEGAGVEKNAVEAARWYRKAAAQRPDAAGALARLYVSGELAADPEQALHWFEVEAKAGGPEVQRALAE